MFIIIDPPPHRNNSENYITKLRVKQTTSQRITVLHTPGTPIPNSSHRFSYHLSGRYPYLYLDGIVLKRSWGGEVKNVSVLAGIAMINKLREG